MPKPKVAKLTKEDEQIVHDLSDLVGERCGRAVHDAAQLCDKPIMSALVCLRGAAACLGAAAGYFANEAVAQGRARGAPEDYHGPVFDLLRTMLFAGARSNKTEDSSHAQD